MAQDAVQIVHLDIGFQPDLLLAGQGAACCGGKGAHPLPALFQLGAGGSGCAVFFCRSAVGQQLCCQLLCLLAQSAPGSGEPGLPGLQLFQRLCGHGLCCGGLLRLQGIHGGLRGGVRLLRPLEGSLCLLHAGAQSGAAGFQCIQRSLCFGSLRVGQGRTLPGDLLFQCVGLCGLGCGRAVCLGCRLFQCRALAGLGLPVDF